MATVSRLPQDADFPCCASCARRARYLRDVADMLGLRDWSVVVRHEPSSPGTLAEVVMAEGRRELAVSFAPDFDQLDPADQRLAVVHELVHPHLRDVWSAVEEGAREAFGGMAYRVYTGGIRQHIERSVDALAVVLAAGVPEPGE